MNQNSIADKGIFHEQGKTDYATKPKCCTNQNPVIKHEKVKVGNTSVTPFPTLSDKALKSLYSTMMETLLFETIDEYNNPMLHVDSFKVASMHRQDIKGNDSRREVARANLFSKQFYVDAYVLGESENNRVFIPSSKNPDIYTSGILLDLKESNGSKSSLQTRFLESIEQGTAVYINIHNTSSTISGILEVIHKQTSYCIEYGISLENFRVFISINEGKIYSYRIENGQLVSSPFPGPGTMSPAI